METHYYYLVTGDYNKDCHVYKQFLQTLNLTPSKPLQSIMSSEADYIEAIQNISFRIFFNPTNNDLYWGTLKNGDEIKYSYDRLSWQPFSINYSPVNIF